MKELSIEEKSKRYDEALERARGVIEQNPLMEYLKKGIEYILPELRESEDEKIRKELKSLFLGWINGSNPPLFAEECNRWIAWLEKQGEQSDSDVKDYNNIDPHFGKPVDKDEPKFHEGDIIIHKELGGDYIHNPHKIIQVDILDKKYRLEGGLVAHFSEQEDYELVEQKPAWSEEDKAHIDSLLKRLEGMCKPDATFISTEFAISEDEDWLKSLKDRVQPQSQWKPTKKQIMALRWVLNHIPYDIHKEEISGLFDQIKRLINYG